MNEQKRELRDVIRRQIEPGMSADEVTDRIAAMFHMVEDEWAEVDVTRMDQLPGREFLRQRWLVARVHRETIMRVEPPPNRTS